MIKFGKIISIMAYLYSLHVIYIQKTYLFVNSLLKYGKEEQIKRIGVAFIINSLDFYFIPTIRKHCVMGDWRNN